MKYIFTRTNLNCQNTSFTNFYFPIVSIRLFEEVAMKRWVCPICKTLYFTIAIFKTSVSQLQTSFTIDKHQLHKCPRAEVAMKRRVCLIWKTPVSRLTNIHFTKASPIFKTLYFTIENLSHNWFHKCPSAEVAMKRRVCPICKTGKTHFTTPLQN